MSKLFKNKVVVVTGASSGLGEALSRQFVENGAIVHMGARRTKNLETIAKELNEKHGTKSKPDVAIAHYTDVTSYMMVDRLGKAVMNMHGKIDIWVNNAGGGAKGSILTMTEHEMDDIINLNMRSVLYGTKVAALVMKEQGYGDIMQILSTSAFTPRPEEFAYCGAKAGAALASASTRMELKTYGIRVFNENPGGMDTEFAKTAGLNTPPNAMNPNDIAKLLLYKLSLPRNVICDSNIYRNG